MFGIYQIKRRRNERKKRQTNEKKKRQTNEKKKRQTNERKTNKIKEVCESYPYPCNSRPGFETYDEDL